MNRIESSGPSGKKKMYYAWIILLSALPYTIIISIPVSNVNAILFFLVSLIVCLKEHSWRLNFRRFIFASSLYWVTVLGLLFSISIESGWTYLDTRAYLVCFPLFFSLVKPDRNALGFVVRHLVISLSVTFVVCISIAVYKNFQDPAIDGWVNKWHYTSTNLSSPIDIEPLYLSLFIGFGILVLISDLMKRSSGSLVFASTNLKILLLLLLIVFLYLLASRSIILATGVCGTLLYLINFNLTERRIRRWSGFILIIAALSIFLFPVTVDRFAGTFERKYSFSQYSVDRLIIWSTVWGYVEKHPTEFIFGKGTGSSRALLDRLYKENNVEWDFDQKNNPHNQYLDFLICFGIVGLVVLVMFLGFSLREFWYQENYIAFIFIAFISIGFLFENYLDRQKGVIFIGLLFSLFYFSPKCEPPDRI